MCVLQRLSTCMLHQAVHLILAASQYWRMTENGTNPPSANISLPPYRIPPPYYTRHRTPVSRPLKTPTHPTTRRHAALQIFRNSDSQFFASPAPTISMRLQHTHQYSPSQSSNIPLRRQPYLPSPEPPSPSNRRSNRTSKLITGLCINPAVRYPR
jgi:hypothetical protein